MSKFKGVKTDNAKIKAKVSIREDILSRFDNPRVIEFFCGSGHMYQKVWIRSEKYLGIDIKKYFDDRDTVCADCTKAAMTIDLKDFNIFDIDAYGDPYGVLSVIIQRINDRKKKTAFIITDGTSMDLRMGRVCKNIREMAGINCHILKRAHLMHGDIINKIISHCCDVLDMRLTYIVRASGKTGAKMRYYAFILDH
jgi:hypothetical protein